MQKLPLQPPYYDMAPSESTPFTDKPVSSNALSKVKGAACISFGIAMKGVIHYFPSANGMFRWMMTVLPMECW